MKNFVKPKIYIYTTIHTSTVTLETRDAARYAEEEVVYDNEFEVETIQMYDQEYYLISDFNGTGIAVRIGLSLAELYKHNYVINIKK